MKHFGLLIVCLFWCGFSHGDVQLPKGFRLCKNDTNLEKCFVDAANNNYYLLKKGEKPEGVIPIEPLKVGPMSLLLGNDGVGFFFKVDLFDGHLTHNLDRFINAHIDFNKRVLDADLSFNNFTWHSKHNSSGRFLLLNVKGHGNFRAVMHNLLAHLEANLTKEERDGGTFWHVEQVTLKLTPKKITVYAENVVPNKEINNAINGVVNDNWYQVLNPVMSTIEKTVAPTMQDYINSVLDHVPEEQLILK